MYSTEKATPASGSPAAVVVVVACSRERPRRHLLSIRRTSTFGKSHNRQPEQRLALRSWPPSFMKCGSVTIQCAALPQNSITQRTRPSVASAMATKYFLSFVDPGRHCSFSSLSRQRPQKHSRSRDASATAAGGSRRCRRRPTVCAARRAGAARRCRGTGCRNLPPLAPPS
jgi:hypothetical protein